MKYPTKKCGRVVLNVANDQPLSTSAKALTVQALSNREFIRRHR